MFARSNIVRCLLIFCSILHAGVRTDGAEDRQRNLRQPDHRGTTPSRGVHVWSPGMGTAKRTYDSTRDSPFAPPFHGDCDGIKCDNSPPVLGNRGYVRDSNIPENRHYVTVHDSSAERTERVHGTKKTRGETPHSKEYGYPGVSIENAAREDDVDENASERKQESRAGGRNGFGEKNKRYLVNGKKGEKIESSSREEKTGVDKVEGGAMNSGDAVVILGKDSPRMGRGGDKGRGTARVITPR